MPELFRLTDISKLVMGSQPPDEHWIPLTIYQYALPGKWAWVVLLCRSEYENGESRILVKPEMVIWDEELQEYLIMAPFDMEATGEHHA